MNISRAGILWNDTKVNGLPVAKELARLLRGYGCEVMSDHKLTDALECGLLPVGRDPECDVMFVLGGDGTLLSTLDYAVPYDIPVLGINLGRMGFLTEIEPDELEADLARLFAGDFWFEDRMTMTIEGAEDSFFALNEIVIARRNASTGIFTVETRADGTLLDRISGDGLIIASATGSTAYSLSAGGPIVAPGLDCFVMTPVCPHTMNARPVVASAEKHINVSVIDKPDSACAVFDGRRTYDFSKAAPGFNVVRGSHNVRFIRMHKRNYFELLRSKLSEWTH